MRSWQRAGVGTVGTAPFDPAGIFHLKKLAADSAAEVGLGLGTGYFGAAPYTA